MRWNCVNNGTREKGNVSELGEKENNCMAAAGKFVLTFSLMQEEKPSCGLGKFGMQQRRRRLNPRPLWNHLSAWKTSTSEAKTDLKIGQKVPRRLQLAVKMEVSTIYLVSDQIVFKREESQKHGWIESNSRLKETFEKHLNPWITCLIQNWRTAQMPPFPN